MGAVARIVAGAAIIAGGIAASIFAPGAGIFGIKFGVTLIGLGASTTLGGIASALKKPNPSTLLDNPQGRVQVIKQAAAPRRVIYGQSRVGGILSFANVHGLPTAPTAQNQLVVTLAGHAIDSVQEIQFDDEVPELSQNVEQWIGVGAYTGKAFVQVNFGDDGQSAFPSLLTDSRGLWSTDHRQRGCAGAYVRLNFDEAIYPNGVPNISFIVRGKPVYDPRNSSPLTIIGATNASPIVIESTGHAAGTGEYVRIVDVAGNTAANGTWKITFVDSNHFSLDGSAGNGAYTSGGQGFRLDWSDNATLIIADYLMDPWIGMGVPWAKLNEAVLLAATNVCDEELDIDAASPATTEKRYTINGAFETSELHGEILAQMANAMAGHVTYIGGEWHIIPGAFRLAVMELTDADVVAPMNVEFKRSRRDLVNGIKGTFPSAAHNYIETDFPAITNATYLAEDRGVRVWKDIFLPFTTSASAAQRIALIELERNRRQWSVEMTCSMRAYELQPGDVMEFTHSHYSWALETFEVAECGLGQNESGALTVSLQLVQTDVDVYGFAVDEYGNLIDPDLLELLSRTIPFGWSPAWSRRPTSTAATMAELTDYSFGIAQQYRLAPDGTILAQIRVGGYLPLNVFSTTIQRPRTRTLAATTQATGGFLADGERFYIGVSGIDAVNESSPPTGQITGRLTPVSEIAVVDVPTGSPVGNANTVTLTGLRWDVDTKGWLVFFGRNKFRLSTQSWNQHNGYLGFLTDAVTVTGSEVQPDTITFTGFDEPGEMPDGLMEHYIGAPDHRFDHLRFKGYRGIHLGVWGGQVASTTPTTITLAVDPATPFTANIFAGRFVSCIGVMDTGLELVTNSGIPLADFLIESNDGDTLTLSAGQLNPADHGFVLGAVVVIRTKATAVGTDATGNYIEDTGFGQGGQVLGDNDPNIGGGDDSLVGGLVRIISGTGAGTKATIVGNSVASERIYVEVWEVEPDTTSVFIVTDAFPSIDYTTDPLRSDTLFHPTILKFDASDNLAGEQYIIYGISVSHDGKEASEDSSPYREIYMFGAADGGILVTADYKLKVTDRFVRVMTISSPPVDINITLLPPARMKGLEILLSNVGTSGKLVHLVAEDASEIGGEASIDLEDGESVLLRGYSDV